MTQRTHTCLTCGGTARPSTVSYEEPRDNQHCTVTNIPAYVCDQCRDVLYDDIVIEQIENILGSGVPVRTLQTLVYDFTTTA